MPGAGHAGEWRHNRLLRLALALLSRSLGGAGGGHRGAGSESPGGTVIGAGRLGGRVSSLLQGIGLIGREYIGGAGARGGRGCQRGDNGRLRRGSHNPSDGLGNHDRDKDEEIDVEV